MSDDRVLVWHKNYGKDGKAVVHVDGNCPSIVNRNPPRRSVAYAGRDTAGWLPRYEARQLRNEGKARDCEKCM
jgi:hypothetical protein